MQPARRFVRRWYSLASLLTLLAFLGIAGARTAPEQGPVNSSPIAVEADPTYPKPTDPNVKDPDYGKPADPLPKKVTGWASNQDATKPKWFPHYGRIEFPLCDLPVDKDKGGTFNKWSEDNMRSWCRSKLKDKFGMDADYTNHELVEDVPDGAGGTKKVLAVYKTWKTDHEKAGRGKLYHPRKPGQENYYGGISQMQNLEQHHFQKAKPKKKRVGVTWDGQPVDPDSNNECPGEVCEICGPCATNAFEAADFCGEGEACEEES
jgi:hypothetical protein